MKFTFVLVIIEEAVCVITATDILAETKAKFADFVFYQTNNFKIG